MGRKVGAVLAGVVVVGVVVMSLQWVGSLLYPLPQLVSKIVGVDIPSFQFLVIRIEDLQDILTDELVVSVHYQHNRVITADIEDSIVYVFHSCLVLVIFNISVLVLGDVVEVEVLAVGEVTAVVGGVVDDDCKVVRVILTEN